MISPADLDRAGHLLLRAPRWIFAKTMAKNPHWYTRESEWSRNDQFRELVSLINNPDNHYVEHFYGKPYRMFNLNGHKHWTMPCNDAGHICIINRKPLGGTEDVAVGAYDAIADSYDACFSDPASLEENADAMEIVGDVGGKTVLDIGCGTGLLLDYLRPARYLGIDPSRRMLDRFVDKHPSVLSTDGPYQVMQAALEEFVLPLEYPDGFDVVTCLFGSVNYCHPEHVQRMAGFVKSGGRLIVMFLGEEYTPVTYERSGHTVPFYPGLHAEIPIGSLRYQALGNFTVLTGVKE